MKHLALITLFALIATPFLPAKNAALPGAVCLGVLVFLCSRKNPKKQEDKGWYSFAYKIMLYGIAPFPAVILIVTDPMLFALFCVGLGFSIGTFYHFVKSSNISSQLQK